jgi:hypothetical protein
MRIKMERKMRKTLILIAVLLFSIVFSACDSVSAHSPPFAKSEKVKQVIQAAAAQTAVSSVTAVENLRAPAITYERQYALENPTVELAPTTRSNPISIVNPNKNYQKGTDYIQPPDRFIGFGSDNNARAKI